MGIIEGRINFKPFEYGNLMVFREAIRRSRWDVEEFDFSEDIQVFHTELNHKEQTVIKRAMLAISQVEAGAVKTFWVKILEWIKSPEVGLVGITLGENEVTHSMAYAQLLEILGFNEEFKSLLENPIMKGRVDYLNNYLFGNKEKYSEGHLRILRLIIFVFTIENTSLFGGFAVIKSFRKKRDQLKSIDNVVLSTQKDELVHAQFGIELIRIIKEEHPEYFNDELYSIINKAIYKAYEAESKIIDWIFEEGDLDFITSKQIKEFIKTRLNSSLVSLNMSPIFEIDQKELKALEWFEEEIYAYVRNDFFNTKSSNYNKVKVKKSDVLSALRRINNEVV